MVHHVMTPAELSTALVARKRLLSFVDENVSFELVRVGEAGGTYFTAVRLLSSVDPDVAPQIGNLDKSPVTMATAVRLLPGVQSHVCFQMVIPCKSFGARFTLKGLFTGMGSLMILKHVFVPEGAIADFTREHFISATAAVLVVAAAAPTVTVPRECTFHRGRSYCSTAAPNRATAGGGAAVAVALIATTTTSCVCFQ